MKPRTLILLLGCLAVLGVCVALVLTAQTRRPSGPPMGEAPFRDTPVNETDVVTIEGPGAAGVTLERREERWTVRERDGYPADFKKIAALIGRLQETKAGRHFQASKEALARMSLDPPGETTPPVAGQGTLLSLVRKDGSSLLRVILGKTRGEEGGGPSGGQYVRKDGEPVVYLVDETLSAPTDPAQWLDRSVTKIPAAEIGRILCRDPNTGEERYCLTRQERGGDFALQGASPTEKVQRTAVNRLSTILSSLSLLDVLPLRKTASPQEEPPTAVLEFALFDGRFYRVFPSQGGSEDAGYFLRLEAGFTPPASPPERNPDPQASGSKDPGAMAGEAARESERLGPWVFKVDRGTHEAFLPIRASLLEAQGSPTSPLVPRR